MVGSGELHVGQRRGIEAGAVDGQGIQVGEPLFIEAGEFVRLGCELNTEDCV